MTTTATDHLAESIQHLKDAAQSALNNESSEEFTSFERYLNEVEAYARELQQSKWADEAKATIRRLERNEPLNETDREVLRAFLVSDAVAYLHHENNFGDWVHELGRLLKELEKRADRVDRDNIVDIRGILKDAIRLAPDIRNYFCEKRRVEKFEQAMRTLDQNSCQLLHRLLSEQLRCPNR